MNRSLLLRVVSAAVLLPVTAVIFYQGNIPLTLYLTLFASVALFEWQKLASYKPYWPVTALAITGAVTAIAASGALTIPLAIVIATSFTIAVILLLLPGLTKAQWLWVFGYFYIVLGALILNGLRHISERHAIGGWGTFWPLILLFGAVILSDTAAYFIGKSLGKRKLAPTISPGKTWEGYIGAHITVFVAASLICFAFPARSIPLWWVFGLGLFAPAVTHAGDLFISYLKRRAGIKDCGMIIPGHGGVLDRVDGLLGLLPIYYLWFILIT